MDINPARGKLLAALTIAAVERHAGDAMLIDDQDNLRELRMLRAGSVVLVEHPATSSSPRHINCYVNGYAVEAAEPSFKIGPSRLLYVLVWQHRAAPPNFHLQLIRPTRARGPRSSSLRWSLNYAREVRISLTTWPLEWGAPRRSHLVSQLSPEQYSGRREGRRP